MRTAVVSLALVLFAVPVAAGEADSRQTTKNWFPVVKQDRSALRQETTDANFYEVPSGSHHRFYRQSFALPYADFQDEYLILFEKPSMGTVNNAMVSIEGTITASRENGAGVVMSAFMKVDAGYYDTVTDSVTNFGSTYGRLVEIADQGRTWIALHWYADAFTTYISTDLRVIASDFTKLGLYPLAKPKAAGNHNVLERRQVRDVAFGDGGITVRAGTATNTNGFALYGGAAGNSPIISMNNTDGAGYAGWLRLWANGESTEKVRIAASSAHATFFNAGNVGIGTTAPTERLHVEGNIHVSGAINAKYQDIAEWVPATGDLAPGSVVVLDMERPNTVIAASSEYDSSVAGVVSAQPGLILGEGANDKALVATTGRVRVRVTTSNGPIRIGDLLVTSGTAGVAMKSSPLVVGDASFHRPGTIIGKALERLAKGDGEILVLLSLQ